MEADRAVTTLARLNVDLGLIDEHLLKGGGARVVHWVWRYLLAEMLTERPRNCT
jgi:hypothetical protein